MNLFSTNANVSGDVCTTLFGSTSILTLSKSDVYTCLILAAVVIIAYIMFYNKLFTVTFDENFASATGTNSKLYNLALAIITAVVIVIAMNLVGALLISALIIFPALSESVITITPPHFSATLLIRAHFSLSRKNENPFVVIIRVSVRVLFSKRVHQYP